MIYKIMIGALVEVDEVEDAKVHTDKDDLVFTYNTTLDKLTISGNYRYDEVNFDLEEIEQVLNILKQIRGK